MSLQTVVKPDAFVNAPFHPFSEDWIRYCYHADMFHALLRRLFPSKNTSYEQLFLNGDCDLLIPVFNRPDEVQKLCKSILAHTNKKLLKHIWIGNDDSDTFTTKFLDQLTHNFDLPISVIHHEKNLGFGENCNDLFAHSNAPYCIILNTDIELPPLWIERILKPFSTDPTIALATPLSTNAANHTVKLQQGQHWREADRLLAGVLPAFPDDCTAIGFCMAVNAGLLRKNSIPLFDPSFGRGYGEDTDLHYRIVTSGLRSVIVDNLLVHHEGAASFSVLPQCAEIRAAGESLFHKKWTTEHQQQCTVFQQKNALKALRDQSSLRCLLRSSPKKLDVLFVIPNTNLRYGGIWFIYEIAGALLSAGFDVGLFILDPKGIVSDTTKYGITTFDSLEELQKHVTSVSCIVSTSDRTIDQGLELVRHYATTEVLFLQNMEVVFRSGRNVATYFQYQRIPNVITVSQCLTEYIRVIQPMVNVKRLHIGPDALVFYPRNVKRRPYTVALAANVIPEKGTTQALEIALMLRERGFHFTIFGWDTSSFPLDASIGDKLHDTSREALANLFSHTEFIIDQSHLEGLGLPPLEAAFCGCIPLLGSRGAAEYIFQDGENSITINGYKNLKTSFDRIQALTQQEKNRLSQNAMKLRSSCNLQTGLEDAIQELGVFSGFKGGPDTSSLQTYSLSQAS